jgi:Putative transmembrane protein (PGPGW)
MQAFFCLVEDLDFTFFFGQSIASKKSEAPGTRAMKKVGFTVSGWIIIGLGIAGLALPFIPGVVLIVLGLVILSSHYVWAQGALAWLRRRFPKTLQFADLQLASLRQRFTTR